MSVRPARRAAWPRPTPRGVGVVVCGVAFGGLGVVLASAPIVFGGLVLVALVLAAAVSISIGAPRFAVSRSFSSSRAVAGCDLAERVTLVPLSSSARGRVRLSEKLPWGEGSQPDPIVVDLGDGLGRTVSIPLERLPRGRHVLDALVVDVVEPFGLATRRIDVAGHDELIVVPESSGATSGGASHALGEGSRIHRDHSVAGAEDDPITREYRRGDAMRRVHWRATARHGELMVRQEEQHGLPSARIVLSLETAGWQDARPRFGSRPDALAGDAFGSDGFEWALSAAATLAVRFGMAGAQTRLLAVDGATIAVHDPSTTEMFLELLADVDLGEKGLDRTPEPSPREPIVAVVSSLTPADVVRLGRMRGPGVRGVAIVVMLGPVPFEAPGRLAPAAVATELVASGWRVVEVDPTDEPGAVIDRSAVLSG